VLAVTAGTDAAMQQLRRLALQSCKRCMPAQHLLQSVAAVLLGVVVLCVTW
jgi:hypothetical protein